MKRYKLKTKVKKLIITMVIVAIGIGVYIGLREISPYVAENSFYEFLTIIGLLWIIFFQNILLSLIWEYKED